MGALLRVQVPPQADHSERSGMTCSMSRKGNCRDHAPTESWFNSFKNERVHEICYATHGAMKAASFEYIEVFYNRTRQHSPPGLQVARTVPGTLARGAAS